MTLLSDDPSLVAEEGTDMKCWICGDEEAATREHLAKLMLLYSIYGLYRGLLYKTIWLIKIKV